MKIVLLGSTGHLGKYLVKELQSRDLTFYTPTHKECSIERIEHLEHMQVKYNPDLIIHAAGFINTEKCEIQRDLCLEANVLGTYNVVKLCRKHNIRLAFMSSEYVFPGDDEEYPTGSALNPKNIYGLSKACGEFMVKTLENYIILRSPFIRSPKFLYPNAFYDQFTCRRYIHETTKDIINYSISLDQGIKHILGKYQSVYELAKETKNDVLPIKTSKTLKKILPINLKLI